MFAIVRGVEPASIEIVGDGDIYVPVAAETGEGFTGDLVALRYGDCEHSLLEVFFDLTTGRFYRLTMPMWKQPREGVALPIIRTPGIPILEPPIRTFEGPVGWWRIDCQTDFTVALDERLLTVTFDGGGQAIEGVESGRLTFLVTASKHLVGFQIRDLPEADVQTLRQYGAPG